MKQSLESNSGTIKKSAIIIALLLAIVGLFEWLPAVDHARAMFPADWKEGQDCYDVLAARPWYGQINPWFWFWMISTPVVTFSVQPGVPAWQRILRTVLIIILSYVVIILAGYLETDARNAPFSNGFDSSDATVIDRFKIYCLDVGADSNYVFASIFGWLPASIYTGWWEIIWGVYHKRKTKLIDKNFKRDWVSRIVVFISVAVSIIAMGLFVWRAIAG